MPMFFSAIFVMETGSVMKQRAIYANVPYKYIEEERGILPVLLNHNKPPQTRNLCQKNARMLLCGT